MNMFHRLMHLLKLNCGRVVSKLDKNGNVWIGFQCGHCGEIQDRHKAEY